MPDNGERVLRTTIALDEGESREVEVELPDGYLTPDEVRKNWVPVSRLEERVAKAKNGRYTVDELLENEDLLARVASSKEDWFRERLKIEGEKPDMTKLQETWRQQELKPVSEQLEQVKTEVQKLRSARLSADVSEAAMELGVKKSHVQLLGPYYEKRVAWSDEHGDWFIVDGNGEFEYSAKPHEGSPYLTIGEDLERKARSGDYEDWFDGKGRTGPDYQGGKSDRHSGRMDLAAFKKLSDRERTAMQKANPDRWRELMGELTEENRKKLAG